MAQNMFKIVLKFNWAAKGWSEEYYWSPGGRTIRDALAEAKALMDARRLILGKGPMLEAAYVEDVSYATPFIPPHVPAGPNPSSATYNLDGGIATGAWAAVPVDAPEQGALTNLYTQTSFSRRSFIMHGLPRTGYVSWGALPQQVQLVDRYANAVKGFWASRGIFPVEPPVFGASFYWLRVLATRAGAAEVTPIIDVSVVGAPDYHWVITVPNDPEVVLGDTVHVHGASGCWKAGLNRDHVVTKKEVHGGQMDLILNHSQCCLADIQYNGKATYFKVQYIYAPIQTASVARYAKRDTGSRFFGTRGRRRSRCCKP